MAQASTEKTENKPCKSWCNVFNFIWNSQSSQFYPLKHHSVCLCQLSPIRQNVPLLNILPLYQIDRVIFHMASWD